MVLNPLSREELEEIFDDTAKKVINYFLDKMIFMQPELHDDQKELPIQIPKEHIEQWIVQALDIDSVGAGSYCVDVIKKGVFGADVKMLSCEVNEEGEVVKNKLSGETSLAQNFKDGGANLDVLFKEEKYDVIVEEWKKILNKKYLKLLEEVRDVYYFILLRANKTFYLCGIKVSVNDFNSIVALPEESNKNNAVVGNMIDKKYANVRIYKAKKRMELRLNTSQWIEEDKVIKFEFNTLIPRANLRKIVKEGKLEKHKKSVYKKVIKNGKFKFRIGK